MSALSLPEVSASILAKAQKYLLDGHVTVTDVQHDVERNGAAEYQAVVQVQGSDPSPYLVHVWGSIVKCGCPARVWACAHLIAALHVLDVPHPAETGDPNLGSTALSDLVGDPPSAETVQRIEEEIEASVQRRLMEERSAELDALLGLD